MKNWVAENPMTFMLAILFGIVAVVGGVVCVVNPDTLSFNDYLTNLAIFGGAVGLFGAGRAVKNGIKDAAISTADDEDDPDEEVIEEEVPDEEALKADFPDDPPPMPEGDVTKFGA